MTATGASVISSGSGRAFRVAGTSELWKEPKSGYITNMVPPNNFKHPHMALLRKDEWQSVSNSATLPTNPRNPMWATNGPRPVPLPSNLRGYQPASTPDLYPTEGLQELGYSRNQKKNPDASIVSKGQNAIDPRIYEKVKVAHPVEAENQGTGPRDYSTTMKQHYVPPPRYAKAVDWIDPRVKTLSATAFTTDRADMAWGLLRPHMPPIPPNAQRSTTHSLHTWRRPADADPSVPVEPYNYMNSSLPGPTGVARLFAMKQIPPDLDDKTLKMIKIKDPVEYGHLTEAGFSRKSSSLAHQPAPYQAGRQVHRVVPGRPDEAPYRTGYEKNFHHRAMAMPPNRNPSKWTGTGTTSAHFHTRKPMNNPNVNSTVKGVYYERSGYTRSTKKDKSSPVDTSSFRDPLEMLKGADPEVVATFKKQHSYLFEERPVEKKDFTNWAFPRPDYVVVD